MPLTIGPQIAGVQLLAICDRIWPHGSSRPGFLDERRVRLKSPAFALRDARVSFCRAAYPIETFGGTGIAPPRPLLPLQALNALSTAAVLRQTPLAERHH